MDFFFLLGPRAIAPGTGPNSYEIAAGISAALLLLCGFFLLIIIILLHLPDEFRFATSPATRRVAGHIIYQNVRLDRDRCAITFLNSVRIFRDVSRDLLRKIFACKSMGRAGKKERKRPIIGV